MRTPGDLSVSVVIPSIRGGELLFAAVDRLLADAPAGPEIVVADNGLPQDAVAALQERGAKVLRLGANLGFGAAVNRAAHAAEGDALVVLNDDLLPEPGFLDKLVAPLAEGFEMAAGVLVRSEQPGVIESAGLVLDRTLGAHDYLQNEPLSRLERPGPPPFAPTGGAAAYRRSDFLAVGGFDEAFFAYLEDVDLAIRLRARGARCALARGARAVHASSATLGYDSLEKAVVVGYSRGHLLRKYGVLRRPGPGIAALLVELGAVAVLALRHRSLRPGTARLRGFIAPTVRERPPSRSAYTVGVLDGLRRRYARSLRFRADRGAAHLSRSGRRRRPSRAAE